MGFRDRPTKLCQSNLVHTDPCCHGNEYMRFSTQNCLYVPDARMQTIGVSVVQFNGVSQTLIKRPPLPW